MKIDTVILGAAVGTLLAACGAKEEQTTPPEGPRGVLAHVEAAYCTHVYLVDLNGTRCAVLRVTGESGGISCDWSRPPILGDVEMADAMPAGMRARCSTDSECAEMFGGDGGPEPLREYLERRAL